MEPIFPPPQEGKHVLLPSREDGLPNGSAGTEIDRVTPSGQGLVGL